MVMVEGKEYTIKPVKDLPSSAFRGKRAPYSDIIAELENMGKGTYEVCIRDRKVSTVYLGLKNALKDNKMLKVHKRKQQIFIEKF